MLQDNERSVGWKNCELEHYIWRINTEWEREFVSGSIGLVEWAQLGTKQTD